MLQDYDWSVGCTFTKSIENNPVPHLHVVFAQSKSVPHLCMVAFICRVKGKPIPSTETRLFKGDHKFVQFESYLVYALVKTYYHVEIAPNIVNYHNRLKSEVLYRIQSTCLLSDRMPNIMIKQFCQWMDIEYKETFTHPYM